VHGKDNEYEGELAEFTKKFHYGLRGAMGMTHSDPGSRPASICGGNVTLHAGQRARYLFAFAHHSYERCDIEMACIC
jgi:hypothetical protein